MKSIDERCGVVSATLSMIRPFPIRGLANKSTVVALCRRWKIILAFAPVTFLLISPAFADESFKLECTLDRYSPGSQFSAGDLRNALPDKVDVQHFNSQNTQIYFPSLNIQMQGDGYRENAKKITLHFNIITRGNFSLDYQLVYFKESKKIDIEIDAGAGYERIGGASGTCKFPVSTKHDVEPGASDSRVCAMSTGYGDWLTSKSFQDWIAEAHKRNLSLEDCKLLLRAN